MVWTVKYQESGGHDVRYNQSTIDFSTKQKQKNSFKERKPEKENKIIKALKNVICKCRFNQFLHKKNKQHISTYNIFIFEIQMWKETTCLIKNQTILQREEEKIGTFIKVIGLLVRKGSSVTINNEEIRFYEDLQYESSPVFICISHYIYRKRSS